VGLRNICSITAISGRGCLAGSTGASKSVSLQVDAHEKSAYMGPLTACMQ
jgi:hypothetical protein